MLQRFSLCARALRKAHYGNERGLSGGKSKRATAKSLEVQTLQESKNESYLDRNTQSSQFNRPPPIPEVSEEGRYIQPSQVMKEMVRDNEYREKEQRRRDYQRQKAMELIVKGQDGDAEHRPYWYDYRVTRSSNENKDDDAGSDGAHRIGTKQLHKLEYSVETLLAPFADGNFASLQRYISKRGEKLMNDETPNVAPSENVDVDYQVSVKEEASKRRYRAETRHGVVSEVSNYQIGEANAQDDALLFCYNTLRHLVELKRSDPNAFPSYERLCERKDFVYFATLLQQFVNKLPPTALARTVIRLRDIYVPVDTPVMFVHLYRLLPYAVLKSLPAGDMLDLLKVLSERQKDISIEDELANEVIPIERMTASDQPLNLTYQLVVGLRRMIARQPARNLTRLNLDRVCSLFEHVLAPAAAESLDKPIPLNAIDAIRDRIARHQLPSAREFSTQTTDLMLPRLVTGEHYAALLSSCRSAYVSRPFVNAVFVDFNRQLADHVNGPRLLSTIRLRHIYDIVEGNLGPYGLPSWTWKPLLAIHERIIVDTVEKQLETLRKGHEMARDGAGDIYPDGHASDVARFDISLQALRHRVRLIEALSNSSIEDHAYVASVIKEHYNMFSRLNNYGALMNEDRNATMKDCLGRIMAACVEHDAVNDVDSRIWNDLDYLKAAFSSKRVTSMHKAYLSLSSEAVSNDKLRRAIGTISFDDVLIILDDYCRNAAFDKVVWTLPSADEIDDINRKHSLDFDPYDKRTSRWDRRKQERTNTALSDTRRQYIDVPRIVFEALLDVVSTRRNVSTAKIVLRKPAESKLWDFSVETQSKSDQSGHTVAYKIALLSAKDYSTVVSDENNKLDERVKVTKRVKPKRIRWYRRLQRSLVFIDESRRIEGEPTSEDVIGYEAIPVFINMTKVLNQESDTDRYHYIKRTFLDHVQFKLVEEENGDIE